MTKDASKIAAQCRHYAMCKIDYLDTGLCPSGAKKHYVAYYPQGRMDIYDALINNNIPVTQRLVDIVETCNLCGICDKQCHFITGLRPLTVMDALKKQVADHLNRGNQVFIPQEDQVLKDLRQIVGSEWATNDPAILISYSNDPFPLTERKMPSYVVLPGTTQETAAVVKLAVKHGLPYVVRGNGSSVFGMVFSQGIVLDMNRMQKIEIDAENWTATVEAGVTAFDLQQEALKNNFRINSAEPAATVCGNIICTGLFSTWSAAYGTAADHFVDLEFVDKQGQIFTLNEKSSPNLFAYEHSTFDPPGICTRAMVRLHPITADEEGLLIPFEDFQEAVRFARELNLRRIGLAIAVIGTHYISSFFSLSEEFATHFKNKMSEILGIKQMVFVVTDSFGREAIKKMTGPIIDNQLLRMMILGLPNLLDEDWLDLIQQFEGHNAPYEILCNQEMLPLLETILQPSSETIAEEVEEDLKEFYTSLYHKQKYTDMVWLNMFRIVSTRMARHKHVLAFLIYVPMDRTDLIVHLNHQFKLIGDSHGVDNEYGFLTPMDLGKRAILEYDYYIDHTSQLERKRAKAVIEEASPWLDELALNIKGVTWIKTFFSQGCARKESIFYQGFNNRS